ncbi:hypothetical protein M758_5G179200 [Ceratodon purpureus]|nr:hypothetical protein M758_5G179200 [Ceratodon purpureus]
MSPNATRNNNSGTYCKLNCHKNAKLIIIHHKVSKTIYHGTGLLTACLEEDPLGTNTASAGHLQELEAARSELLDHFIKWLTNEHNYLSIQCFTCTCNTIPKTRKHQSTPYRQHCA